MDLIGSEKFDVVVAGKFSTRPKTEGPQSINAMTFRTKIQSQSKKVANSHRHLFKIKAWSDKPNKLSDASSPWLFSVTAACECGVTQEREPTAEEIEEYIGENSFTFCNALNANHQSQSDCIKYLSLTVRSLEDKLDKMAEEISDIKGQSLD